MLSVDTVLDVGQFVIYLGHFPSLDPFYHKGREGLPVILVRGDTSGTYMEVG